MIFPDVNLLVYAHDETSDFHKPASKWLKSVLTSEQVFFSWHTITGFLRITTNPRIYLYPLTTEQAIRIVDTWLERENSHLVFLEKKNWPLFSSMLIEGQAKGNLVMDAHVAAMVAELTSTNRDFTRFPVSRLSIRSKSRPVRR